MKTARILEIGPFPPPHAGWAVRIALVKAAIQERGHTCVALNLGENRTVPSPEYECVYGPWDYLKKLLSYSLRGYLLHIHTNGESAKGFAVALVATAAALLGGRRPVVTFHAGTEQKYFPRANSRPTTPVLRTLFGAARAIVCNNADVKACIVDYGVDPTKVFPIPAFSRQYLEGPPATLDASVESFLVQRRPVVLTYVECRPEYALDRLFAAVAGAIRTFPRLGLIVVGASQDAESMTALLRSAGLANQALHLPTVEHAMFLALLRRASVYLRSGRTEGSSSSIREALALGVPVVANEVVGQPEGVVTYPWADTAAMTDRLVAVLQNGAPATAQTAPAQVEDTLAQEVELLVNSSLGRLTVGARCPVL